MIEILVGLLLLVIVGAGASFLYDKNKDKINAKLKEVKNSFEASRQATSPVKTNPPPRTNRPGPKVSIGRSQSAVRDLYQEEYEEFKASMEGSDRVTLDELRKRLNPSLRSASTQKAISDAKLALAKGDISLKQANKRILDALTKLKK